MSCQDDRCYLLSVVDVKTAVANAIQFAKDSLGESRTLGIRLEEIDSSTVEGNAVWLVTLSNIPASDTPYINALAVLGADAGREYKVFTVSKDTGQILSMKIRLLAVPS